MTYPLMIHLVASFGAIGIALGLFSLFSRAHRGIKGDGGFWASKHSFTPTEYAANRTGFVMNMLALLLALAQMFLL